VFLKGTLKLDVQQVSLDEHDREMAYVHALTFLLGRAFHDLDIPNTPLKTKTYQHLLDVRRIVENDTAELFETIQKYNPYAADMRQQLVVELQRLNDELAVER
jgi:prephenate dehydrogenase